MLAQPLFSSWSLCENSQVCFRFHQAVSSLDAMLVWFSFLQSYSILLMRFSVSSWDTRSELLGSAFPNGSGCLSCYQAEFFLKWNLASVLLVVSALDPAIEREVFPTFSFCYYCSCPGCARVFQCRLLFWSWFFRFPPAIPWRLWSSLLHHCLPSWVPPYVSPWSFMIGLLITPAVTHCSSQQLLSTNASSGDNAQTEWVPKQAKGVSRVVFQGNPRQVGHW